ncbi:hypothetical protein JEA88_004889 [Salmonella enterica]|uniref:hypothetical protein n=1 Tax=Enterobacteriaceae TaxID=543 RepID=UPI000A39F0F2|nr:MULTISPECIES: hypothetical protein [Enterobacteriaceae]EAW7769652.1 hypothetical protein [Salmonella enterica]EDY8411151.1 hypothetical protein [Salmonella enterica]EFT8166854.1 hypothetical protein [Salmonella enterica]EGU0213467.1 hypothetical protein [Salmonella enterica]EIS0945756.1 hypothetical protein [Salmonella enterica]
MTYFLIAFVLIIGGTYLAWKLTNNLYRKLYRMADHHGRAALFESIVRENNYTQPRDLERAYQEAVAGIDK